MHNINEILYKIIAKRYNALAMVAQTKPRFPKKRASALSPL
jgi:hypothetical protein